MLAEFFIFIGFANLSNAETLYIFGGAGFSQYEINEKDKTEINSRLTSLGFGSAETTTDAENATRGSNNDNTTSNDDSHCSNTSSSNTSSSSSSSNSSSSSSSRG